MSGSPRVRPYETQDREAVRNICFETGYLGNSIAPLFADRDTFADMLVTYYVDHEPEHCFVVEIDGQVGGYVVGTFDARHVPSPEGVMIRRVFTRLLPLRPGTAGFLWRGLFDSVFDLLRGAPRPTTPNLDAYPAHTHMSLLPHARLAPVSIGLYRSFFAAAKKAGCPGVHGEVFAENEAACKLHEAMGFKREGKPTPAPGIRSPDGKRMHVQLWLRDL